MKDELHRRHLATEKTLQDIHERHLEHEKHTQLMKEKHRKVEETVKQVHKRHVEHEKHVQRVQHSHLETSKVVNTIQMNHAENKIECTKIQNNTNAEVERLQALVEDARKTTTRQVDAVQQALDEKFGFMFEDAAHIKAVGDKVAELDMMQTNRSKEVARISVATERLVAELAAVEKLLAEKVSSDSFSAMKTELQEQHSKIVEGINHIKEKHLRTIKVVAAIKESHASAAKEVEYFFVTWPRTRL